MSFKDIEREVNKLANQVNGFIPVNPEQVKLKTTMTNQIENIRKELSRTKGSVIASKDRIIDSLEGKKK